MSSKHSMPEMKEGGVNVTPLIDIVMCLIIFFMLVAKIGVKTGGAAMSLPETIIGVKLDKLLGTLIINVSDPNFETSGEPKKTADGKPTDFKSENPVITAVIETNGQSKEKEVELDDLTKVLKEGLKRNKEFSVTVRAQKQLKFSAMQKVIAAIGKAGVTKVNYAGSIKKG